MVGVAVVAAVMAYEHAYALVCAHGEWRWTARLIPLTVHGLVYASSMVMLDSARRGVRVPVLAQWLLGLGITAALVGSYELLMVIIQAGQPPDTADVPGTGPVPEREADRLQARATEEFADHIEAGTVPSVRAIQARLR